MNPTVIFKAIGEVFGFFRDLNDPDKRKKKYELYLDKRRNLAIDYAEQAIYQYDDLVDYLNMIFKDRVTKEEKKDIRRKEVIIRKYVKLFFKNN